MGNSSSSISEAQFKKNWKRSQGIQDLHVWTNRHNPNNILEQYAVRQVQTPYSNHLSQLRRDSTYYVNAYEITSDELFNCGNCGNDKTRLLIERMPVRLSNVKDIPFPDLLHLYDTALNGYEHLSQIVGFFLVDDEQIGISDRGQVKIWVNPAFELNVVAGIRVTQGQMIRQILHILDDAVDRQDFADKNIPVLHDYLMGIGQVATFNNVKARFNEYVRQYNNFTVPLELNCVYQNGGANRLNSWCRNNESYGFQTDNIRRSEQFLQSKFTNRSTYLPIQQVNNSLTYSRTNALPVLNQTQVLNSNNLIVNNSVGQGRVENIERTVYVQQEPTTVVQESVLINNNHQIQRHIQVNNQVAGEQVYSQTVIRPEAKTREIAVEQLGGQSRYRISAQGMYVRQQIQEPVRQQQIVRQQHSWQQPIRQQPIRLQQLIQQQTIVRQEPVRQQPVRQQAVRQQFPRQQFVRQQPIIRQQPIVRQQPIFVQQQIRHEVPLRQQFIRQQPIRQQFRQQVIRQQPIRQEYVRQEPIRQQIFRQQPIQANSSRVQLQQIPQGQIINQDRFVRVEERRVQNYVQRPPVQEVLYNHVQVAPPVNNQPFFQPQIQPQPIQLHSQVRPVIVPPSPRYQNQQVFSRPIQNNINQNSQQRVNIISHQGQPNVAATTFERRQVVSSQVYQSQPGYNPSVNTYNPITQKQIEEDYSTSSLRANDLSKLQQQRVLSEAIEIRQTPTFESTTRSNNFYTSSYNNAIAQESSPAKISKTSYSQFNYNNIAPSSSTSNYKAYQTDDDKPSPAYLALMEELMQNKSSKNQLYESRGNTPISYAKEDTEYNRLDYLSGANAYQTYSRDGSLSQDRANNRLFQTEERTKGLESYYEQKPARNTQYSHNEEYFDSYANKYSGRYNAQKYSLAIDDDLMADINKFK